MSKEGADKVESGKQAQEKIPSRLTVHFLLKSFDVAPDNMHILSTKRHDKTCTLPNSTAKHSNRLCEI